MGGEGGPSMILFPTVGGAGTDTLVQEEPELASRSGGDLVAIADSHMVRHDAELGRFIAGLDSLAGSTAILYLLGDVFNIWLGSRRFEMEHSGKASEIGETKGFIKLVIDADKDRILGAAVLASEGAELVHTYVVLMNADVPLAVLRNAVFIHPTLSEAVQSAAAETADS